jgi:hypothetical protein
MGLFLQWTVAILVCVVCIGCFISTTVEISLSHYYDDWACGCREVMFGSSHRMAIVIERGGAES